VLGECSCGIYLLHGIALDILFVDLDLPHTDFPTTAFPLFLPIVVTAVILITPLTYLLVERPAMRQGKELAKWLAGRRLRFANCEIDLAP
jgi:peptidoglycan/LPS O-acetylase OafA/YrhL